MKRPTKNEGCHTFGEGSPDKDYSILGSIFLEATMFWQR